MTLRSLILVFHDYNSNLYYLYLLLVDLTHIGFTIYGTVMNIGHVREVVVCYIEMPVLCNFMYILLLLGYMYCLRMFMTILHFKFGIKIYAWLKTVCRCFRTYETHVS